MGTKRGKNYSKSSSRMRKEQKTNSIYYEKNNYKYCFSSR